MTPDFSYAVKNHNDFIETTAETGIFGGLAFLALFVIAILGFVRAALKPGTTEENLKYLFLPAFGLLAYSVDAFFNFPANRPEIQVLFAIYLALAAANSSTDVLKKLAGINVPAFSQKFKKLPILNIIGVFCAGMMAFAAWALLQNSISLHYQLLARTDNLGNHFNHPAEFFLEGFPAMPNLTCLGEPIVVNKARYLIVEKRYRETINLLLPDASSPYDSRRDYYLSMTYDKMGMTDSTIYWARQAYTKQPLHGNLVMALSSRLVLNGNAAEGVQILDKYLAKVTTNPDAWLMAAKEHWKMGDAEKSLRLLDSAAACKKADTTTLKECTQMRRRMAISPYEALFEQANRAFVEKKYPEAIALLNEFIAKKPKFAEAYGHRALAWFYTGRYENSILDIDLALKLGLTDRPDLFNLRGVANHQLGRVEDACRDFKLAMEKGDPRAAENFRRYCEKK